MRNKIKAENDPHIFKEIQQFLSEINNQYAPPMEELNPEEARKVLTDAQKSVKTNCSGVEESEQTISHSGHTVNIHIVKPHGVKDNAPVFVFIHGGGWVLGDYPTHRRLVRDLVIESGAVAIFPDYTPSPEARYPVAINQIYAVTSWVAENGNSIGVNGKNMAIAGNSVGGNIAAVVSLMAKEKKGPTIKLQVLLWPVTDANFETESYNQYAEDRFLTKNMMKWFWDHYLPEKAKRKEIYASPLQADLKQLQDLPEALVITAENDVLRDEGEAYARKLDEAGVPVTLIRYAGLIHDFGLLNPLAEIPSVRRSVQHVGGFIRNALKE